MRRTSSPQPQVPRPAPGSPEPLIVADVSIPLVEEAFAGLGRLRLLRTTEIKAETVRDADLLVVRTETPVDPPLLRGSQVRFVASASTGTDHVELDYLRQRGTAFAHAPGCNADAVAQYTLAAILWLCRRRGIAPSASSLGVIGVGQIGSRVARFGSGLGMEVLQNDPPRARQEGGSAWKTLDDCLQCDVVTIHTPLIREGPDKTWHLVGAKTLRRLQGRWLINTSRGPVVDNQALKSALRQDTLAGVILDVWENEPEIDFELVERAGLATAHVAARSLEGWIRATEMVYRAACRFLGVQAAWSGLLSLPPGPRIEAPAGAPLLIVDGVVASCCDILTDDASLRALGSLDPAGRGQAFRYLRRQPPRRREFSAVQVSLRKPQIEAANLLEELGFAVSLI